jgi:hypothetical protein
MGVLFEEAFNHAPDAIFTLEANTHRSRDAYTKYGFKVRILHEHFDK